MQERKPRNTKNNAGMWNAKGYKMRMGCEGTSGTCIHHLAYFTQMHYFDFHLVAHIATEVTNCLLPLFA